MTLSVTPLQAKKTHQAPVSSTPDPGSTPGSDSVTSQKVLQSGLVAQVPYTDPNQELRIISDKKNPDRARHKIEKLIAQGENGHTVCYAKAAVILEIFGQDAIDCGNSQELKKINQYLEKIPEEYRDQRQKNIAAYVQQKQAQEAFDSCQTALEKLGIYVEPAKNNTFACTRKNAGPFQKAEIDTLLDCIITLIKNEKRATRGLKLFELILPLLKEAPLSEKADVFDQLNHFFFSLAGPKAPFENREKIGEFFKFCTGSAVGGVFRDIVLPKNSVDEAYVKTPLSALGKCLSFLIGDSAHSEDKNRPEIIAFLTMGLDKLPDYSPEIRWAFFNQIRAASEEIRQSNFALFVGISFYLKDVLKYNAGDFARMDRKREKEIAQLQAKL